MRYHVPGKDALNNNEKKGTMQKIRRFLSSDRTPQDYMGKPATLDDYERGKKEQLRHHYLLEDESGQEAKSSGSSSFRVNSFTPKEKVVKKPVTEKVWKQKGAEVAQTHQKRERELVKKFGVDRDNINTSGTGLKSVAKRKLRNPFGVRSMSNGHYTEEDYEKTKRELNIKHGVEEAPEAPPSRKARTVQRLKHHFTAKPYYDHDTLVYTEKEQQTDSKKTLEKIQQYTEKIRTEKEKRRHYKPTFTTFEQIKKKNDELINKRDELRKQGLEPSEHKRKRIINLEVPSYLKKEQAQEHLNRYRRYWRLKKENDRILREQRKKVEQARQQEKREGTYVETYKPSSSGETGSSRGSVSYVPVEKVKYKSHEKSDSVSYVPLEDVKYKSHKRSGNADIPKRSVSYVPVETVSYQGHKNSGSVSYVPLEQIPVWRTTPPPSLKIKLVRWGKRGAKYVVAGGITTFQYIRNKIFDDDDGDPTTDTEKKAFARMQLEKDFYQELLVSDVQNSKGPWKIPHEAMLKARWAVIGGKVYTIRGKTFTIDGVLNHDFGYARNILINKSFTFGGRTFALRRHYRVALTFSIAKGIKLASRIGKYGFYAGVTIKNRLSDMLESDGLSDTGIGSIAYTHNRYLLAKEYYNNAKTAYRVGKSAARTAYRGASWAARGISRFSSAAYRRVAVPLIRGAAALVKALLSLVSSKALLWGVVILLFIVIAIAISGALATVVTSLFAADEKTVYDYRDMIAGLDEGFRMKIEQYRDDPLHLYDDIDIHYMNGDGGIETDWRAVLALASVYRRQDIDFSKEEQDLINEIYDKLNYTVEDKSSKVRTRPDGGTAIERKLDVYVYTLPVSDILDQYFYEQWEYDWYYRLIENADAQYPQGNSENTDAQNPEENAA